MIFFSGYLSGLHNFPDFIQMFRFPQFLSDFFRYNDKHVKQILFLYFFEVLESNIFDHIFQRFYNLHHEYDMMIFFF